VTWRHVVFVLVAAPALAFHLLEALAAWVTVLADLFIRWAGASIGRQVLLVLLAPLALVTILMDAVATWWQDGAARWRALS